MAERLVVDASVALAYVLDEVGTPAAHEAVRQWISTSADLLVPSHFWIEITHVLGRRRGFSPAAVVAELVDLDQWDLRTVEVDRPLLLLALDQMVRSGLTAYDAIYLALALSTQARLATLDRRLAEAAGDIGILIGSAGAGRISEQRAEYRISPYDGWAHTAVVGAHIAELRRQALAEA